MNNIKPATPTSNHEAHLKAVCAVIGEDYPERPPTLYKDLATVPKPMEIVTAAMRDGRTLEDIKDDLVLSHAVSAVMTQGGQLQRLHDALSEYPARREAVLPGAIKHSRGVYKTIAKVLKALPVDALDRDAVFEAGATQEYKELLTCLDTLNLITGLNGDIEGARNVMAICQYVVIDETKDGDLTGFLKALRHDHIEAALFGAVRGEYGDAITATVLPTREQIDANIKALNGLNTRLHYQNAAGVRTGSR